MRRAVTWVALAAGAGAWLGILGRVAMRLVALEADLEPGLSAGGSLEVVAFGVIIGTPVALVVWGCRRRWSLPRWSGTAAGLCLFAVLVFAQPPAARSALVATADTPVITALLFAAVFASYGVVLDLVWNWRGSR